MGKLGRREFTKLALLGAAAVATSSWVAETPTHNLDPNRHFFVIGDLHHKMDEGYEEKTAAIISSLWILAEGKRGFHVVFNGDMIHFPKGKLECRDQEEQWERFSGLYLKLKEEGFIPHLVFGNHDGPRELAKTLLAGIAPREEMEDYVLQVGKDTKLIMLSASKPAETSLEFLKRELGLDKGMRKVVLSHFPPDQLSFIPGLVYGTKPMGLWAGKGVLEAISSARVPLISSHSHTEFAGEYSSKKLEFPIEFLGTPSVFRPLKYWETEIYAKRALGITLVDSRNIAANARFFNGWKPIWARKWRVRAPRGEFAELHIPQRLARKA